MGNEGTEKVRVKEKGEGGGGKKTWQRDLELFETKKKKKKAGRMANIIISSYSSESSITHARVAVLFLPLFLLLGLTSS